MLQVFIKWLEKTKIIPSQIRREQEGSLEKENVFIHIRNHLLHSFISPFSTYKQLYAQMVVTPRS